MKKYNFSAGPAKLHPSVISKAQESIIEYENTGISILEISHRSSEYKEIMDKLKKNLSDLLNVRSFLDHNRIYTTPIHKRKLVSTSTGAFCYQGKKLNNNDVEQNLIEHFQKWAPYLKK